MSLIFILTNPFQCYLSLSVWCVYMFIYNISISIICVSKDKPSLIASNQQIYDFYMWIFEKKRYCGKLIFDITKLFIKSFNVSCCEHITGDVNNIYMGVSVYWLLSVLCVFVCVCVWYQIRVLVKNHIMC